ncbi:MAG TPA: PIG-L family deacetylase, partial [Anaerolineaceae bacterium]|nr:PIG-L family deacetylase [Anaerolineaceae bacterium]
MKFNSKTAEIYIPTGLPVEQALARTTHLCIAAHQDDIEIMAAQPILACFHQADKAFTGVVVTDGRGSPRDGLYKDYTDEAMRLIRFSEQRKAADVGEYAAMVLLDYPSKMVKDPTHNELVEDLITLLRATKPKVVYTHNLADKHDTHVA